MKSSFVKEIETSENVLALLAKRKDIVEAVHDTFLSSEDIEVVERLCVALSDLYRGDESGRKSQQQQRNGETTPNNNSNSPSKGTGQSQGGVDRTQDKKELLINRRCLCLQFLPAILIRYLSLLVSQTSKEEMVLSLIEAFLVVICTNSTKKLSPGSGGGSKSVSMNELDSIGAGVSPGDSFVVVPNLLKPSVYMYNNEVLFAKDFISYPSTRVEVVKLRSEPSISKLDSSNRQEVLTFTLSQYNSYLSQFNLTSQKQFCHMCSCFVMSGFDLSKTKLSSGAGLKDQTKSNDGVKYLNKRFVLSQGLMIEMLQGLYQLSFLLSLRDECATAVEHVAFRARHSLMPQVMMMTHSVKKAIERSVLKQDDTILSAPEVKFQDRVKAVVTSDALRMAARRESLRLEHANYYQASGAGTLNTAGTGAVVNSYGSTAAETDNNARAGHKHDLKMGAPRGSSSTGGEVFVDQYSPSCSKRGTVPSAAVQELEYYKLGSEAHSKRLQQQQHLSPPSAVANPPTSLTLDLSCSEGYGSQHCDNTSNGHALNASYSSSSSQHLDTSTHSPGTPHPPHPTDTHPSPRHSNKAPSSPSSVPAINGKDTKEKCSAKRNNDTTVVTQLRNDSGVGSSSVFGNKSSPRKNTVAKLEEKSGKKGGVGFFSKQHQHNMHSDKSHCADNNYSRDNFVEACGSFSSTSRKNAKSKYLVEDDEDSDRTIVDEYTGLMNSFNSSSANSALLMGSMKSSTSPSKTSSRLSRDDEPSCQPSAVTSEVRSMVRSSIAAEVNAENSCRSSASAPLAVVTEL